MAKTAAYQHHQQRRSGIVAYKQRKQRARNNGNGNIKKAAKYQRKRKERRHQQAKARKRHAKIKAKKWRKAAKKKISGGGISVCGEAYACNARMQAAVIMAACMRMKRLLLWRKSVAIE